MPADDSNKVPRYSCEAIDDLLGVRLAVLDDGFVRVVDYMGGDEAVVQAARISYGEGTKKVQSDRALIRYLMRHKHTSPFEMCEIKLHVRVPMDCWRQWIRHRTANVNEYSTRYSKSIDSSQRTDPAEWRQQAETNRQGSGARIPLDVGVKLSTAEEKSLVDARAVYEKRLEAGVAREQARKELPLSTYTEAYWKIDLHNLLNFLTLRLDERAQAEIRAYAYVIGHQIVQKWCPIVWQAFLDYRLNSLTFSDTEMSTLTCILAGDVDGAISIASEKGWIGAGDARKGKSREYLEFEEKLRRLGLDSL